MAARTFTPQEPAGLSAVQFSICVGDSPPPPVRRIEAEQREGYDGARVLDVGKRPQSVEWRCDLFVAVSGGESARLTAQESISALQGSRCTVNDSQDNTFSNVHIDEVAPVSYRRVRYNSGGSMVEAYRLSTTIRMYRVA